MTTEGNCRDTLAELERFLDRELPADKVRAVMLHLDGCVDCQGAYEFHAELTRIIRVHAQNDDLDPGFAARLRDCLRIDTDGGLDAARD